jgi:translation initiation factor 2B subunit (eIF-2B alpha/beta/delta family)
MRHCDWLTESDRQLAKKMQDFVIQTWETNRDPAEYTPHDPDHFRRVEDWIAQLVPDNRRDRLTDLERKLLTWCAWTHDIGMFRAVGGSEATASEIRKTHVDKSADWVADEWQHLGLSKLEAQIVADINRYHSRHNSLRDCPEERLCQGQVVRTRLLAAYLRLADALDVSHPRVDQEHRFELLVRQISREADTTVFHWIKSLAVADISVHHDRHEIEVEFFDLRELPSQPRRQTNNKDSHIDREQLRSESTFRFIKRYVLNEIEDELASVEQTLALGGISAFHIVSSHSRGRVRGHLENQLRQSMHRVMIYVQMAQSPSSTEVTHAALDATSELLERTERIEDREDAWDFYCKGLQRLEQSLNGQLVLRQCHMELRRICIQIRQASSVAQQQSAYDLNLIGSLKDFVQKYNQLVRYPAQSQIEEFSSLFAHSRAQLPADAPWTFMLYGCSETVATALALFERTHPRLRLAIAEGRPKSQHGARNKPTYIDAENFLMILRSAGVRTREIYFLPDACVATSFDRGRASTSGLSPIDAVLLGANGILVEPEIAVVHSAGHLGVAIAAQEFRVPVVIFSSTAKITVQSAEYDWTKTERIGNKWLTTDTETLQRLREGLALGGTWNPREDRVPAKMITAIVTDQGIVKPHDERAKALLHKWCGIVNATLEETELAEKPPGQRVRLGQERSRGKPADADKKRKR